LLLIDADELFPASCVLAKAIVGDPIKPGGKFRLAAEAANVFVSANKGVLGQIVGECEIAAGELAQQTSHARLMTTNQLAKSVLVVIDKNSSDKAGIS
jgi:hypothetical protein